MDRIPRCASARSPSREAVCFEKRPRRGRIASSSLAGLAESWVPTLVV